MIQTQNRFCAVIGVAFLFVMFMDGAEKEKNQSDLLIKQTKKFLTEWLVEHDLIKAMKHVSNAPLLGSCARTPDLIGKLTPTHGEFRDAIQTILKRINDLVPSKPDLEEMISQTQAIASGENIAIGEHFELFSVPKDFNSARFLCKFDDNRAFRTTFESSDIWYLAFKIKSSESSDLSWIISWRKEGNRWMIFSISPLED